MRPKVVNILLLACIMTSLAILLTGCDSSLGVNGNVYEWLNAPPGEKGEIYIDEQVPEEYVLRPIGQVNIVFYEEEDIGWSCSKPKEKRFVLLEGRYPTPNGILTSDSEGHFEEFWVVGPGDYDMKIVADKEGYWPVEKVFPFDGGEGGDFVFTVVVVPKS